MSDKHQKIKTQYKGIRYREHLTRKYGIRKDHAYYLRYKIENKDYEELFGWETEGFTIDKAVTALAEIKANIKKGTGYFSLREKRENALNEKENEKKLQEGKDAQDMKVGDFYDTIYQAVYYNGKSETSIPCEISLFNNHIRPYIGNKRLSEVNSIELAKILTEVKKQKEITVYKNKKIRDNHGKPKITKIAVKKTKKGLGQSSVNHIVTLLKSLFNRAIALKNLTGDNPASLLKKPKIANQRIRFLTEAEEKALLEELKDIVSMETRIIDGEPKLVYAEYSQVYEMAVHSLDAGLRAGELFELVWSDIDFINHQTKVRDTKNGENRFIRMTSRLYSMLKNKKDRAGNVLGNELVYKNKYGEKMTDMSNSYQKTVDALGFNDNIVNDYEKVVFHTLRHTFASRLVQKGVDLYTVKYLMGHSSIEVTQRYAHLAPNNYNEAILILEKTNDNVIEAPTEESSGILEVKSDVKKLRHNPKPSNSREQNIDFIKVA